ncbi:hypothetical protein [Mucilaginibacter sp. CSA2-8R]|uniref:DUF6984 family protein n=1 Tax=Mucilaginibacter sp. CSA2-8R TaxID=3141542 RepID=UPI00315DFCA3
MEPLQARPIREEEILLVSYLVSIAYNKPDGLTIPATVYTMNDGGMGSIRFTDNDDTSVYQRDLVNAECTDEDGVPIFISLNLNTGNKLYELDMFKGDFNPLKRFPTPHDLRSIR